MAKCIFCRTIDPSVFNTREHILPESLGGGDWALLPPGLFCDACQNIFGSTIEQQALADYPFINVRTLLGIPTKKGKAAWFNSWEGRIDSAGVPGMIHYEPAGFFQEAFEIGSKTQMRLLAEVKKPDMVLRALLKMGLEVVASDGGNPGVFDPKFDAAREYALRGSKSMPWSFIFTENFERLNSLLRERNFSESDFLLEVLRMECGEVLHLKLLYLDMFVPLESGVIPDSAIDLEVPQVRVVSVE